MGLFLGHSFIFLAYFFFEEINFELFVQLFTRRNE